MGNAEGPTAPDRHEARIADLGEDHGRHLYQLHAPRWTGAPGDAAMTGDSEPVARIALWDISPEHVAAAACDRADRTLTAAEWEARRDKNGAVAAWAQPAAVAISPSAGVGRYGGCSTGP
jgi:hypothetical protein